jgi:hypothetical protein
MYRYVGRPIGISATTVNHMAKNVGSKIKKTGDGGFELLRVRMKLTEQERDSFIKEPRLFLKKFLEAHGQKVTDLLVDDESLQMMIRKVGAPTHPIGTLETVYAHVERPKKYKSTHILIQTLP